jgi:hypothetical protein
VSDKETGHPTFTTFATFVAGFTAVVAFITAPVTAPTTALIAECPKDAVLPYVIADVRVDGT